jgi:hypothetical protein
VIASNLALKEPITGRVDYLVVMVDMKSKLSLERLYESFPHVGVEYSLARSCMVILNGSCRRAGVRVVSSLVRPMCSADALCCACRLAFAGCSREP